MSTLIPYTTNTTLVRAKPPALGSNSNLPPCFCSTISCALIHSSLPSTKSSHPHPLRSNGSLIFSRKSVLTRAIDSQTSELQLPTHYSAFIDYTSFGFLQHLRLMPDNLALNYRLSSIVPQFSLCITDLSPTLSTALREQREVRPIFLPDTDAER